MKYKKELKSMVALGIPTFIGCVAGSTVIPYILSKDNSMFVFKIICSFIGVALVCIVKFIIDIKRNKLT